MYIPQLWAGPPPPFWLPAYIVITAEILYTCMNESSRHTPQCRIGVTEEWRSEILETSSETPAHLSHQNASPGGI